MFSPDIIILGLIAGFILFRLYTIVGRRDDDGSELTTKNRNNDFNNIIDISSMVKTVEEDPVHLSPVETELAKGFEETVANVRKIEPNFSLQKFLDGAKSAFEMVLSAFADDDRATLKNLLSDDVYKQFTSEIDKRIKNKITLSLTLVALPNVKIKAIELKGNYLSIDVFYESQQINLIKNDQGEIIEGNSSQIDYVEDTWGFTKELNGRNNWKLVEVNAT